MEAWNKGPGFVTIVSQPVASFRTVHWLGRTAHWVTVLLFFCGAVLAAGRQAEKKAEEKKPDEKPPATKADYVGSETCQACHEDIFKAFQKSNRHAALETDKHRGWETKACEACHGPGSKHAESADKAEIRNPKSLPIAESNKTCLRCHTSQPTQVGRVVNGHGRNYAGCWSCHPVHATPEKPLPRNSRINALCATCHTTERAAFQRPHSHPLASNTMSCVDCHNPHGSMLPKALAQSIGGEPGCLKCHSDKRGPFAFEHAPVRLEGCRTCHEPHGSANPRMLTRADVASQCLECHANIAAPGGGTVSGALGGIPPALHDLRSIRFRNCTICHQKVHGSHVSRGLFR